MERLNADLELVPWNIMEIFSDIDDKCYSWQTLISSTFNELFPISRKRIRQSTQPLLDKSLLSAMRRRDQFHRKARKLNQPPDWSEYRRLRNLIRDFKIRGRGRLEVRDRRREPGSSAPRSWREN